MHIAATKIESTHRPSAPISTRLPAWAKGVREGNAETSSALDRMAVDGEMMESAFPQARQKNIEFLSCIWCTETLSVDPQMHGFAPESMSHPLRYGFSSCLFSVDGGWLGTPDVIPVDIRPQRLATHSTIGDALNQRAFIRWYLPLAITPEAHSLGRNPDCAGKVGYAAQHRYCVFNCIHSQYSTLVERKYLQVCLRYFLQLFSL